MVKNQDHHLGHLHSMCQRCNENKKLYEFSGSEMSNLHDAIKMRNSLYTTCSIPSYIMSQTVQLYTYLTGWWQAAAAAWVVTWPTKVTSPHPLSEYYVYQLNPIITSLYNLFHDFTFGDVL